MAAHDISEYSYELPPELIAKQPIQNRSESRMMVVKKHSQKIQNQQFMQILDLLQSGDVLVFNDTKVINARLHAKRKTGANIEIFLLEENSDETWTALLKNSKKVSTGEELDIAPGFSATLLEKKRDSGHNIIRFNCEENIWTCLEKWGEIPLPPYVDKVESVDGAVHRYQTVFAKNNGAVAAPTAGLHFTDEIIEAIKQKGVQIQHLTLHVGYGTFKPMETDNILDHKMHSEKYMIAKETADTINMALKEKRRIIAVGTTVTRTLEAAFKNGMLESGEDATDIFIYPGFKFNVVSCLLTNFHLPKSTLMCLVSALAGQSLLMDAYKEAVAQKYRFYSFGDAMFIEA